MALVRLHNDDWGYESNCFVCEPRNELGLRLPFFHDTDAGLVRARLELGDAHSGAPTLVHGGVVLAVLDEAMAWTCIAIALSWAVTTEMSTSQQRPRRSARRPKPAGCPSQQQPPWTPLTPGAPAGATTCPDGFVRRLLRRTIT